MDSPIKRFAPAAIVVGVLGITGAGAISEWHRSRQDSDAVTFFQNGRQYAVHKDGRRVVYPNRETCIRDVPPERVRECEPVSNYRTGAGYYGPIYRRGDTSYRPDSRYASEPVSEKNVGKGSVVSKSAVEGGFGSTAKGFNSGSGA